MPSFFKLKNICVFIGGYGLFIFLLSLTAVVFANLIAYCVLMYLIGALPQFIFGSLVYIPFFWRHYKFKAFFPLLLSILICALTPLALWSAGYLRRQRVASTLYLYSIAVENIQSLFHLNIASGQDFIIENQAYAHLGKKIKVSPKDYGSLSIAFKQHDNWPESVILFVKNENAFHWDKINAILGKSVKLKPHWYAIYETNPVSIKKILMPDIKLKRSAPYCPYRRR